MSIAEIGLVARASGLVSAGDLRRLGHDSRRLERLAAAGVLVRVRRGTYVEAEVWAGAGPGGRHRLRVLAAAGDLPGAVFSHQSAAAVWGLPIIGVWPAVVHVSGAWNGGGRSSGQLRWHGSELPPSPEAHDGVVVTSAARTVVDLARTCSFAAGVTAADHALRTGLVTRAVLSDEVSRLGSARGVRRAKAVVGFADERAESVGESLSRARIHELGLEPPQLQVEVVDGAGRVGRVDFWWESVGLVGEFDGRQKYRVAGIDDQRAVEERLWAEKLREDRIRATGRRMTRWTWTTALDARRLDSQLAAAGVRRIRR
ncbi:type IV toxin-antitoxin system AbiEi family antitoxin domain-containing protein [Cellulomonas sp. URHD0024]|uniref:type IV toxin-antitoxin system AbiEi family antitoxin domain-containing protein n=1 Tax=Cellulomonas sp. URHD0024 TaxID=1302620 RepID=UPI00041E4328|nr:type IV toxin-antitoxin system AbiEi family antitoxin domain-containing protein [Cellulomonas sp. URHD0024]